MGLRPLLAGNVDPRQSLLDRPRRLWLSPVPRRHRIRLVPFGTRRRGLLGRRDSVDRLSSRAMVLCGRLRALCIALAGMNYHFVGDVLGGAGDRLDHRRLHGSPLPLGSTANPAMTASVTAPSNSSLIRRPPAYRIGAFQLGRRATPAAVKRLLPPQRATNRRWGRRPIAVSRSGRAGHRSWNRPKAPPASGPACRGPWRRRRSPRTARASPARCGRSALRSCRARGTA